MKRAIRGCIVAVLIMLISIGVFLYFADSKLEYLGSFIGGVSLFLTAIAIWLEANIITARNFAVEQYASAINSFRAIYEEFWTVTETAEVRCWLVSEVEYNENLKDILVERNRDEPNMLCHKKNIKLDKLDRFLAVLVRIRSFNISAEYGLINDDQKDLWNKVLNLEFWIEMIFRTRPDLWTYLNKRWKAELVPLGAPERYDPTFKIKFPLTRQYQLQSIAPGGRRRGERRRGAWKGLIVLNIFE